MPVQEQSPELVFAQTAAFANEQLHPYDHALQQDIGWVSMAFMRGESVTIAAAKSPHDRTFSPGEYAHFLERIDPETQADIAFLADNMREYPRFSERAAAALVDESRCVGKGSQGKGFWFVQDGEALVVKTGGVFYADVRAFRRGASVEGIAHLKAIDLDRRAAVMNRIPGKLAETMSFAERTAIPRKHLTDVSDKVMEMHDAGLTVDPKSTNFLYDPEKGFGIIDYLATGGKGMVEQTKAQQVIELKQMLTCRPDSSEDPAYGTPEAEELRNTRELEDVQLLDRFLGILEADYPDILQQAAAHQAAINADPDMFSTNSMVYPTDDLPAGAPFDAFKARIERLGLQGREAAVDNHDQSVIELPIRQ
jgi:hypothetical protein